MLVAAPFLLFPTQVIIGTAVALVGTISGTLLPMTASTGQYIAEDVINGLIIILGTITTLLYFQYLSVRRPDGEVVRPWVLRIAAEIGQAFLIVTFASLYAGAIISSLTIVSERVAFLLAQRRFIEGITLTGMK